MNVDEGVIMHHSNRKSTYLMLGAAGLAIAIALGFGINPAYLLIVAVCPLVMFFMMRSMNNKGGHQDNTDHGRERNQSPHAHGAESSHR